MARHGYTEPKDVDTGDEIYDMIVRYADESGMLPNAHALWKKVIVGKYKYAISRGCFDYHWLRFQIAGLVTVDETTKAYKVRDVDLIVKKT